MITKRDEIVRYWWERSLESLESAQREYGAESYLIAINRLYYAAFYAVSALLLERDMQFTKHSGVRSTFHREIIRPGIINVEWGEFYDQLFEDRQESDYLPMITFQREYLEDMLDKTQKFLKVLSSQIKAIE